MVNHLILKKAISQLVKTLARDDALYSPNFQTFVTAPHNKTCNRTRGELLLNALIVQNNKYKAYQ